MGLKTFITAILKAYSDRKTLEKVDLDVMMSKKGTPILYICDQQQWCCNSIRCGNECRYTTKADHAYFGKCNDINDLMSRFEYDDDREAGTRLWVEQDIWPEEERC